MKAVKHENSFRSDDVFFKIRMVEKSHTVQSHKLLLYLGDFIYTRNSTLTISNVKNAINCFRKTINLCLKIVE